ncbi:hypothetical protein [Ramlibacter albus]|uniref:Carboxypeptidase regulatory-like domain-containing protein n=1 Tax=Ramlibacter albus TaxID=2079448 RepID=A0A923S5E9_9BURK|nr:hypothetical protein [Ramlibacter albus]MBC5765097.1 hypothetical protein [Ramlibacter albus]
MERLTRAALCAAVLLATGCGGGADVPESSASAAPAAMADAQASPAAPARQAQAARLDTDTLLNWAERTFPTFFPGTQPNRTADPFVFRAYPNGNYLGVALGGVYVLGPVTGGAIVRVGSVASFTCAALASSCAATGSTVTGQAMARGIALTGAGVTLRDSTGGSRTATTDGSGNYTISVAGMSPPYVVTASGTSNGTPYTLYSVSTSSALTGAQRVNLSAWTSALAAMLSPTGRAADLSAVEHASRITVTTVTQVVIYTRILIAPTLTDNGLSSTSTNPITDGSPLASGLGNVDQQTDTGMTPNNAVFMGRACAQAQLGSCPRYTYPPAATTTTPNVCGYDIASGAPIRCDPTQPTTATPTPISITPSTAYNFGCSGCVFWGQADNYAATPTQTPLRVSTFTFTGTVTTTPSTGGSETWQATFSARVCVAGTCVSAGDTVGGTSYNAQATCTQSATAIAQALNASAIPGFSYTFTCRRVA